MLNQLRTYILDGKTPVQESNILRWGKWFSDFDRRVVKKDRIEDVNISTMFIGLDHRYLGDGPPLLFETMVFGGPRDGQMYRYSSWDDAVIGHEMEVKRVQQVSSEGSR